MTKEQSTKLLSKVITFFLISLQTVQLKHKDPKKKKAFAYTNSHFCFKKLVLFIVSGGCTSLQSRILRFFHGQISTPSKSALVQARGKLQADVFCSINTQFLDIIQKETEPKRFKGYQLFGIDGSTNYMPQTEACREEFGFQKNQHGTQCFSRVVALVDLLNYYCHKYVVGKCKSGEVNLADGLMAAIPLISIVVLDRLYTSILRFYEYNASNQMFLVRARKSYNAITKKFSASNEVEAIVEMQLTPTALAALRNQGKEVDSKTKVTLRLIKYTTSDGDVKILITNILDKYFTIDDFKEMYRLRWEVEIFFDVMKNKARLENFSGHSPENVKQDIQAAVVKYNLVTLIETKAQEILDTQDNSSKKYRPVVNTALAYCVVTELVKAMSFGDQEEIEKQISTVLDILVRFHEPERPGRSYKRNFKINKARGKCWYVINYKMVC
jgi:IS4 transposase